jgi:hypothetical protein
MSNCHPQKHQTRGRSRLFAGLAALIMALLVAQPQPAYANNVTPPAVPANLEVPEGNRLFLVGQAVGTQNYICLPTETGVKFTLFTPQATLFDKQKPLTTHYFSPNPAEGGTIRATWQHSKDTSTVWGQVMDGHSSTDPAFVAPGAIPWLLVTVVGTHSEPTGSDTLAATTFIQRLNTSGGVAPATGCTVPADIGNRAFVPYTTDYFFYKESNDNTPHSHR